MEKAYWSSRVWMATMAFAAIAVGCNPSNFQFATGLSGYNEPIGIAQATDGGFALCGFVSDTDPSYLVVKLDATGVQQWTTPIAPPYSRGTRGGCQTVSDGYLLFANVQDSNPPRSLTRSIHEIGVLVGVAPVGHSKRGVEFACARTRAWKTRRLGAWSGSGAESA